MLTASEISKTYSKVSEDIKTGCGSGHRAYMPTACQIQPNSSPYIWDSRTKIQAPI